MGMGMGSFRSTEALCTHKTVKAAVSGRDGAHGQAKESLGSAGWLAHCRHPACGRLWS